MDVQCKGSAKGFKQTEVFVTSPDVIDTSQSKNEKTSQVQARVVAKRAFF